MRKGRLVDEDGSPKIDRKESYVVVKFFPTRIDIKGEHKLVKDFGTMKKCNKWLWAIRKGMTWDKHMVEESRAELGPPLFTLGEA
jgi:hypothetical protein